MRFCLVISSNVPRLKLSEGRQWRTILSYPTLREREGSVNSPEIRFCSPAYTNYKTGSREVSSFMTKRRSSSRERTNADASATATATARASSSIAAELFNADPSVSNAASWTAERKENRELAHHQSPISRIDSVVTAA